MSNNRTGAQNSPDLASRLEAAVAARASFMDAAHHAAFRLFNGFSEGFPRLIADLYGSTLILHDHSETPEDGLPHVREAAAVLRERLPWLRAGIVKRRNSEVVDDRKGRLLFGEEPDDRICENGVWYALDLTRGRDASFYVDTRNVRVWAKRELSGKTVLNAFAYTGSLGVAAVAGGARHVVQLDRNGQSLALARRSMTLNGMRVEETDFITADFFRQAAHFRRGDRRFDCVFVDPPFFAAGTSGTVDQLHQSARLLNKARPLVEDGGWLVAINNALYVSGAAYMQTLEELCKDGYVRVEEIIAVPQDCVGYGSGQYGASITDPAPFNHSTKIAVLRVRRKGMEPGS